MATSEFHAEERLTEGVARYLQALRERALEHMVGETQWERGECSTCGEPV
jgi:hypothetical protein